MPQRKAVGNPRADSRWGRAPSLGCALAGADIPRAPAPATFARSRRVSCVGMNGSSIGLRARILCRVEEAGFALLRGRHSHSHAGRDGRLPVPVPAGRASARSYRSGRSRTSIARTKCSTRPWSARFRMLAPSSKPGVPITVTPDPLAARLDEPRPLRTGTGSAAPTNPHSGSSPSPPDRASPNPRLQLPLDKNWGQRQVISTIRNLRLAGALVLLNARHPGDKMACRSASCSERYLPRRSYPWRPPS